MQDTAQPFELGHSLKTTPVIGEVVDVQLREASWATLARLRQLADPTASLQALRRWENYLSGNMAGLASVMNTRLALRLTNLLRTPDELPSEAFVAAVLLLRCDRTAHEGDVFAAWRAASKRPELLEHLTAGLIHGGLQDPAHVAALERAVLADDPRLGASAARILAARGLLVSDAMQPLGARALHCEKTLVTVLHLMAGGVWPLHAGPVAMGLGHNQADAVHAAEQVLAVYGPAGLAARARQQLRQNLDASLLGLEALASAQLAHGHLQHDDLQLLLGASHRGRLGPLVAHALGLSGLESSAHALLHILRGAVSQPLRAAALEGFTAISGIEAPRGDVGNDAGPSDALMQHLLTAWGPPRTLEAPRTQQLLFGANAAPQQIIQAAPIMQVGRWQSLRRLVLCRSLGEVRLPPWALVQQQHSALGEQPAAVQQALTSAAPGLRGNDFIRDLKKRGAL